MLLGGSLASVELLPGKALPLAALLEAWQGGQLSFSGLTLPGSLLYLLAGVLWALLIISIIAFIISPEVRKETIKRVIRYTLIALMLHGIIRLMPPLPKAEEPPQTPPVAGLLDDTPPEVLPAPPEFVVNPPQWMIGAVSTALIALLLVIVWLFWQRFFKAKPPTPIERLTREAEQTLVDIQAGADLKDTIMRCYRQMSQIISQEQGLDRRQAMTPREFALFLAAGGLDDAHIQRLTRLFERVRYSAQAPTYNEEQEAAACLSAIVQAYGRSA
ncbi:MAG: DUF4129 domain-containing protein [Anaerolineae bacterium]|nr:DUF4129 domain-containing protein [Anaerolineae bacterium]